MRKEEEETLLEELKHEFTAQGLEQEAEPEFSNEILSFTCGPDEFYSLLLMADEPNSYRVCLSVSLTELDVSLIDVECEFFEDADEPPEWRVVYDDQDSAEEVPTILQELYESLNLTELSRVRSRVITRQEAFAVIRTLIAFFKKQSLRQPKE